MTHRDYRLGRIARRNQLMIKEGPGLRPRIGNHYRDNSTYEPNIKEYVSANQFKYAIAVLLGIDHRELPSTRAIEKHLPEEVSDLVTPNGQIVKIARHGNRYAIINPHLIQL